MLRVSTRAAALAALLTLLAACDPDLGEGNRLERIRLQKVLADPAIEVEKTDAGDTEINVFRCFRTSVAAVGIFTDGSRENVSGRATWRSSDTGVFRVSNGNERDADDRRLGRGVITPVGTIGSQAELTVEFLGLRARADVSVLDARLDISPPALEMAFGTTQLLSPLGVLDGRLLVAANNIHWTLTEPGAARATIDEDFGLLTATQGGPADADVVIVKADPRIEGCAAFAPELKVRINDRSFDRLEVRTEHQGVNPDPLVLRPLTQEGMRVFGIDQSGSDVLFAQDLTSNIMRNHLQAIKDKTEQPLVAEDPDDASTTTVAGFLLSDIITVLTGSLGSGVTTDDARLRIRFDQNTTTAGQLEQTFIARVPGTALSSLNIEPDTRELFPGSSVAFNVLGTYTDSSTQDLTRNVRWSTSDSDIAVASNPSLSQQFVSAGVDASGSVTVDAQRTDPITSAVIKASDSGGGATVTVGAQPLTALSVEPANGSVPVGGRLALRVLGNNGQDLTNAVIFTSANPATAVVDNLFPNNGVVTGVSTGTAGINIRFVRENSDEQVTDLSASATVTVTPGGSGGSGGAGGTGGSGGTGGAGGSGGTGGTGGSGGAGGGGGGLCIPPIIVIGC